MIKGGTEKMDRFELVEKLVKSTGSSYADAKIALESTGWDLLDAAVWLEKNGKVNGKTSHFSTNPEQQQAQQKQQEEERRKEERQRSAARNSTASSNSRAGILQSLLRKAKEIVMDNELIICKRSGEVFLEIPIWLFIILLILSFWPVIIVVVVLFIFGFRYRLHMFCKKIIQRPESRFVKCLTLCMAISIIAHWKSL